MGATSGYRFNEGKKPVGNYLSFALNLSKQTRPPLSNPRADSHS